MNNNDETEESVQTTPQEFREFFTSTKYGTTTWLDSFKEDVSKSLETKSLTRKCFGQSETELLSALTLRSETQYYFDKYTKKHRASCLDIVEDMYNDIIGDLLYSEEQYVTSVSKRARSLSFACFDELFEAVKTHQEHYCHLVGVEMWRAMVSCSNMLPYYVPTEKHELVLSGLLGALMLPERGVKNESAPLITDMFRLAMFAILERDTWLHFETPCGIYYAEPVVIQIYNAGNRPGILVKHGFACSITDQSKVRAYRLITNTLI